MGLFSRKPKKPEASQPPSGFVTSNPILAAVSRTPPADAPRRGVAGAVSTPPAPPAHEPPPVEMKASSEVEAKVIDYTPSESEIRTRAHQIWLRRGGQANDGQAESDWLRAERELKALHRERAHA